MGERETAPLLQHVDVSPAQRRPHTHETQYGSEITSSPPPSPAHTQTQRGQGHPAGRSAYRRQALVYARSQLAATPLLCIGALMLVIGVAPGTASRGNSLIFNNPTLDVFSCVAQTLFFIWVYAFASQIWYRTPSLRVDSVIAGMSSHRRPLIDLAFWGSFIFCLLTAIFITIFARKAVNDDGTLEVHVPFGPVWGEAFVFFVCFLFLLTPCAPGWRIRKDFLRTLLESLVCIFGKPFLTKGQVELRHVLVTNVLTSATVLLWELAFTSCHFIRSNWETTSVFVDTSKVLHPCQRRTTLWGQPIISVIPYWMRIVQCIWLFIHSSRKGERGWTRNQHLLNALKYLFSVAAIVLTGAARLEDYYHPENKPPYFWSGWRMSIIVVIAIRTAFTYVWDVKVNWALWECGRGHYPPALRPRLHFRRSWWYYTAMIANFLLRCTWIATLQTDWCYAGCSLLFAFLEILRRGIWFVFRIEAAYIRGPEGKQRPLPINADGNSDDKIAAGILKE